MITVRCDDVFVDTDVEAVKRIWDIVHGFPVIHMIAVTPKGRGDPIHHAKPLKRGNKWIMEASGDDAVSSNRPLVELICSYQRLGSKMAVHGLFHIDYRKLSYSNQYAHIKEAKTTMSLLFGNIEYFVPPFNKYNEDTLKACHRLSLELIPSYYEADTKIVNTNPDIETAIKETIKCGNCAYHPYWLQGGWKKSSHIINGKRYRVDEAKWSLDDALPEWRKFLEQVSGEQ